MRELRGLYWLPLKASKAHFYCTQTQPKANLTLSELHRRALADGSLGVGCHFLIDRCGGTYSMRPFGGRGCGPSSDEDTIYIQLVGGVSDDFVRKNRRSVPILEDNFTQEQKQVMEALCRTYMSFSPHHPKGLKITADFPVVLPSSVGLQST